MLNLCKIFSAFMSFLLFNIFIGVKNLWASLCRSAEDANLFLVNDISQDPLQVLSELSVNIWDRHAISL